MTTDRADEMSKFTLGKWTLNGKQPTANLLNNAGFSPHTNLIDAAQPVCSKSHSELFEVVCRSLGITAEYMEVDFDFLDFLEFFSQFT